MTCNKLKLNADKTELIVFASKKAMKHIPNISINLGGANVTPSKSIRNLGVHWDINFSMVTQINAILKSCYFHLRNIGKIRRYITDDACKTLVNALVTSRLDYGNALLYGVPGTLICRLQRIQNTAARIISRTSKHAHITPILKQLHWLPVESRIRFKILLYTYKALNGLAPSYLRDLLAEYVPSRSLRSADKGLLTTPKARTVTFGGKCFKIAAPALWNSLPDFIKRADSLVIFKSLLKTHLFKLYYF